jgi:hypothetical protein
MESSFGLAGLVLSRNAGSPFHLSAQAAAAGESNLVSSYSGWAKWSNLPPRLLQP